MTRALVRAGACACVCVHFRLARPLRPCVSLCLAHVSKQQQAVNSCWRCRELKHTMTTKSMRCSRWLAITGVLSSQLPSDTVSETGDEIPREHDIVCEWCGPARYASSQCWDHNLSCGDSGTVQNWGLVSSGQAISGRNTENIFYIPGFALLDMITELIRRKSQEIFPSISLQTVFCFPVSSPISVEPHMASAICTPVRVLTALSIRMA